MYPYLSLNKRNMYKKITFKLNYFMTHLYTTLYYISTRSNPKHVLVNSVYESGVVAFSFKSLMK